MAGKNAFGHKVEYDDSDGSFTAVPNVTNVAFPEVEVEELETTAHDTDEGVRTYEPGLIDPGTVDVEFNFVASDHMHLYDKLYDRDKDQWRITDPDGATAEGEAYIASIEKEGEYDAVSEATMQLRFSGKVATEEG